MTAVPSPCLDICKYKLRGHCIACGMTKMQKAQAERLHDSEAMRAFVEDLLAQQQALGRVFWSWESGYRQKCARHGAPCVLDDIPATDA